MATIEEKIGYKFKDRNYLMEALTHSSFSNEKHNRYRCNERLEFLGDAVISIISARYLFDRFPDMSEGSLTKLRSSLVCTESLSSFARQISLGDFLFLGKGEVVMGGNEKPSILENAFEALTAAIYLDGGYEKAQEFVLGFLSKSLEEQDFKFRDYKTTLQEVIQHNPEQRLNYVIVDERGPAHKKEYEVEIHLNSNVISRGVGKSKKDAEQKAAKEALKLMGL